MLKVSGVHLRSALVGLTLDAVIAETKPIADRFAAAGFSLFLVGGIVRDLQLGFDGNRLDFDLSSNARPPDIKRLVAPIADAIWDQGERFGTIGCVIAGRPYEITTHRADSYAHDTRKPEVRFGDDIVGDLSRRDFTINAMAVSVFDGKLIDPFDGRAALAQKSLATPIEATISFSDDPLRILRAARFVARYELVPTSDVVTAATQLVDRLEIISAERIREEFDKLLEVPTPSPGFAFLAEVAALDMVVPFVSTDRLRALFAAIDRAPSDHVVRRIVVFNECPAVDRKTRLARLRYSNDEVSEIISVLGGIDTIRSTRSWDDESVRRLVDEVGFARLDVLWSAAAVTDAESHEAAKSAFDALSVGEDLSLLEPSASGDDIMAALDLSPGPAVGAAMRVLRERRLRDGPASVAEELEFLTSTDP